MNASRARIDVAAGCLAVTLLAACVSDSKPIPTASGEILSTQLAASPAAQAVAKLVKNLTGGQVIARLGPPASTQPVGSGGLQGQIWSYPFPDAPEVRMVVVGSQEVPAMNPLTGVMTTRSEPVYQNQDVNLTDTLNLLMVDDRLIEWRVVREETKKFQ